METVNETIKEFSALTASRLSGVVGEASKLCSVRIVILLLTVMTTMTAGAQDNNWSSNVNDNYDLFQDYYTENTFEINTAADFANFASFVNDGHDFEGKTVKLGDDIDLSAHFWDLLIGRYSGCCFKGTFDGNGKVIKGLVTPDTGFDNGLFGYNKGAVQNVILDASCSISGEGDLGGISVTNCRKNTSDPLITQGEQNTALYTSQIASFLGSQWTVENDVLILKPSSVVYATDIVNPVFTCVTVSSVTAGEATTDYVDFLGTYSPTDIYTADKTNLYLGSGNTLYYPWADGMTSYNLNACRAYFQLKNALTAGDPNAVREFKLRFVEDSSTQGDNFGDEESQGITTKDYTDYTDKAGAWYDLNGRKVSSQFTVHSSQLKKGLYIHNGRKVAIK